MSGSVGQYNGAFYVRWYNPETKKDIKIYRYKGFKLDSKRMASKLLLAMQTDVEVGTFWLGKYKQTASDVTSWLDTWLKNCEDLSPATYKGYKSYIKNHLKPFFEVHNHLSMTDIQLDILEILRRELKGKGLSPKMQMNVMNCLHVIMVDAKRSRRITHVPSFPRKKKYQLEQREIQWLPEARQLNVIEQIPIEHQPIFMFLKYHLRRPAEACALHKDDYHDDVFTIHRSISAKKITGKTKTGEVHTIPCHPGFEPYSQIELDKQKKYGIISPFFFVSPVARNKGKRYTNKALNILWRDACKKAGEDIDLYSGLKHSSCSQYINEKGLSESELQIITDHANITSVRNYAKTEVKRKRELMVKNLFQKGKNINEFSFHEHSKKS